jgi:Spy/CpxP family protein refolding chaperone
MNILNRLILALTLTAGLLSTVLLAEPAASAPPTGEHGEKSPKKPRISRVEKLSTELSLTDDQKTQIAAIHKKENAALKVVREDQSLERAAKAAKNKEIRAAHDANVRALLNSEQQAKFDTLVAKDKKHDHEQH